MQNIILVLVVAIMAAGGYLVYNSTFTDLGEEVAIMQTGSEKESDSMNGGAGGLENGPTVMPISHASLVLSWMDKTIYVDPVGEVSTYVDQMAPDILLITDIHGDHLSVETIEGIISAETIIVAPQAVYDQLPEDLQAIAMIMSNGETADVLDFSLEATPMYNFPETADSRHAKGRGNGYIITADNYRVLIAGDTGPIPELRSHTDIDMMFMPMNEPYTMSVAEAADLVIDMAPRTVVPFHYRNQDGTLSDVERFKELVMAGAPDTQVLLLNWYGDVSAVGASEEATGEAKTFTISGTNFAFDVTEMRVKQGDTVTVNFESAEGFHDWVVDEFNAATEQVRPGTPTSVTFVADKAGTYEYYCSVGQHRANGMVGTLIVE